MRSMKNFDAMAQSQTPHFPSFGFGVSQLFGETSAYVFPQLSMAEASTAPSPVTPTRSPKLSMKGAEFQAQLRAVFNEFDADGSGSVDTAEIQAMTAKLGMTFSTEEIEAMVRDADTNGNGVLEFDEFEQVIKAHLGKGASANGLGACRSRSRACRSRSRVHPRPAMSPRSAGSRARVCACADGPRRLHLRLARQ
jgi:hypothetical protein